MAKHPKRPRDPAQLARPIVDIASGEVEDREPTPVEQGKDPAAVNLGSRGGLSRRCQVNLEKISLVEGARLVALCQVHNSVPENICSL